MIENELEQTSLNISELTKKLSDEYIRFNQLMVKWKKEKSQKK